MSISIDGLYGPELQEKANAFFQAIVATRDEEAQEALKELAEWTPEVFFPQFFNDCNPYYRPGDENAPFFSEAYLYALLGKEEARTLRALMRPVFASVGIHDF